VNWWVWLGNSAEEGGGFGGTVLKDGLVSPLCCRCLDMLLANRRGDPNRGRDIWLAPFRGSLILKDRVKRRGNVAVRSDRRETTPTGLGQLPGHKDVVLTADVEKDVQPGQTCGQGHGVTTGVVHAVRQQHGPRLCRAGAR
jgi:hypothetical protein